MVGHVLGEVGSLPDIFTEIEISYFLLRRLLGVRTEGDKKGAKVSGFNISDIFVDHYYPTSGCMLCNIGQTLLARTRKRM